MKRRVRGRCGSNGADSCWETISFLRVSSLFIFPTSPLIIRIDSLLHHGLSLGKISVSGTMGYIWPPILFLQSLCA